VQLRDVFSGAPRVESLTVLRRPFTVAERKELFRRLVVATAANRVGEVRELLKEGAPVNLDATCQGEDRSLCLDHWEDDVVGEPENSSKDAHEQSGTNPQSNFDQGDDADQAMDAADGEDSADDAYIFSDDDDDDDDIGDQTDTDKVCLPCGGITPMMMAIATGNDDLAKDLEACGAQRPDMSTKRHDSIREAFSRADFADIVKHFTSGADVNCSLRRGEGVQDTGFGTPLHACAALFRKPGAYETAQLLITKGSNLDAPDEEGDTPLAHARYFGAHELHRLYSGHGASLAGPFYARFGELFDDV